MTAIAVFGVAVVATNLFSLILVRPLLSPLPPLPTVVVVVRPYRLYYYALLLLLLWLLLVLKE